jgi:tetratricopeptide (TPR) repeat protein
MSPEQALAKPGLIDHRSDLYSLGVTLYELLTLHPAYDGRDREELLRQLAVGEPRSPRRLNAAVPGELEKVVLKAMAREPERRYATGEELADDLRRFLDDRPVLARRPTLAMRVVKFGRRHRVATTAAAAVALAALVGLIVTFILVYREKERTAEALIKQEAEARRAQTNFRKALTGAKGLLLRLENRRWDGMPGIAELRADVVGEGLRFFEGFIDESNPEPAVRFQTAQTFRLIAQVYCVQQDGPRAVAALDRAAAVLSPLVDSEPTSWTYRFELAGAHNLAGLLHFSLKQPEEAAVAFAQAAEQYRSAVAHDPGGESANGCAWLLVDCPVEHLRDPAAARALAEHAVARAPAESRFWNTLGVACYRSGDYQAAVTALERSMAENSGGNPWDWFFLAMAHHRLGADDAARSWHAKALRTLAEMAPQPEDLLRYRREAAALMPELRP